MPPCVVQITPITNASFTNTVARASAEDAGNSPANNTAHSAINADTFWRRRENMTRLSARFTRHRKQAGQSWHGVSQWQSNAKPWIR